MKVRTADVVARARELNFLACGVATLEPLARAAVIDEWLGSGRAGTMRYLHRQAARRKAPATIVPGARVAVVVLENYLPAGEDDRGGPPAVRIARYARGQDYHRALRGRLEALAGYLRSAGAAIARAFTDSGPVPERELAVRAGLGWIGKNTMLIRPGAGSFCFIGSVFTDLALEPTVPYELDRCGSCTRCLEACPTEAFAGPHVLDATRCLAYLTIEQRGPIADQDALRSRGWAFGCDICNEVCPWNERFAAPGPRAEYQLRDVPDRADPDYFERMGEEEFLRRFGDTPLERPGLSGMRRNWRAGFKGSSGTPSRPSSRTAPVSTP
jgi:epoxyqueuosine reductase